jgi:uroporphyrinogen-III decarboxylase
MPDTRPMTPRELFRRIMHFETVDRTPLWQVEGIADRAILCWREQGSLQPDQTPYDLIRFDGYFVTIPLNDQSPIPGFKEETLEETDAYVLYRDVHGSLIKVEPGPRLTPVNYIHVDAPLRTLADWKAMEKRFDPMHPDRLPAAWLEQKIAELRRAEAPVTAAITWGPARGIKNGYMFGFDRFMEIVVLEPELLDTVFTFWAEYMICLLGRILDVVPLDAFYFRDDGMGYKNSTLISPATFNRVYKPHMAKVTAFLRSRSVDTLVYYSSGNLVPILPSLLDIGINTITPVESAAGMQALDLRRKFPELRMIGNISREALMQGRAAIEEEVRTKIPPLMAQGGYIPAFDDFLMPDMRLEDILYCTGLVRSHVP